MSETARSRVEAALATMQRPGPFSAEDMSAIRVLMSDTAAALAEAEAAGRIAGLMEAADILRHQSPLLNVEAAICLLGIPPEAGR